MPKSSLNVSLKGADDIFSTEESRQEQQREQVQQIPIGELFPFKNHPFKVLDDESMQRTVESVEQYGVLSPLIARPRPEGGYEIISGHRRQHAAQLAGLETLPVIVRNMDDDAAVLLMVDSNLQRESILPSERAFAYKMKLEALKNQDARSDLTSSQVGMKLQALDIVGQEAGDSRNQVHRFIRLTSLIPELLDMVDEKKIAFNPAVELSYLDESQQRDFLEAMNDTQNAPSLSQAQRLKKLAQEGHFSYDVAFAVMGEEKKGRAGQGGHQKRHPAEILSSQLHPETDGGHYHQAAGTVAAQTPAAERTLTYTVTKDPMGPFSFANKRRKNTMNTTIDLKTAKTIEAMNQKINHMDNAVTDFFNKMSDVLELQLGDDEVYAAVIAPEIELTITPLANVRSYLPCFDETDSCYSISEDVPLALCYDPRQVITLAGKRYLSGAVIFVRYDTDGNFVALTTSDLYLIQCYLGENSVPLMAGREKMVCICID